MKKKILVFGIIILLSCIGLSGCNEKQATTSEDDLKEIFFTISGTITNNYGEDVDFDYSVVENFNEWNYWSPTIRVNSYEVKDFSCEVKLGYDLYFLIAQWFYPDTDTEGCLMVTKNIEKPTGEDFVYYIEIKNDGEMEISQTEPELSTNLAPIVTVDASITSGNIPLTVSFSSIASDNDGAIVSYHWDFKDGESSIEQNPTHTYQNYGRYNVELTVTDDKGAIGIDTITIDVQFPDPVIVTHNFHDTSTYFYGYDIFGIIKNVGNSNIKDVSVKITFYDASNNIITTMTTNTAKPIIKPQQKSAFKITFQQEYYDHYEIVISSYQITEEEPYVGFTIINDEIIYPSEDCERVFGYLKNTGPNIIKRATVYGSFYDPSGNLFHVSYCGISPWTIYSGEERHFSIQVCRDELDGDLPSISNYDLELYYEL